jgi:hypothetical protein
MTSAQWLFEYMAMREKEKEHSDLISQTVRAIRYVLISVLGLNLLKKPKEEGEEGAEETEADEVDESFIPMSLLAGRREVIEHILENMMQEEVIQGALEDDDFEKMSAAIAKGEDLGDMAPLFEVDDALGEKLNTWFTPGREIELQRLGVKIVEERTGTVGHVDIDAQAIKEKKVQRAIETRQAKEQVEEQLKADKKNLKSRGMKVTFDDAGS